LAAYAFARLRFPGRDLIFGIYLSSLMVPSQVDDYPPLYPDAPSGPDRQSSFADSAGADSAFGTFFLRPVLPDYPPELEEAAIVDGAGLWRVLLVIILPLSKPALASLAIFTFNYYWNDFFTPLIFLDSHKNFTIRSASPICRASTGNPESAVEMAGVCMAVLPILAIFLVANAYIVEGITLTGLKG